MENPAVPDDQIIFQSGLIKVYASGRVDRSTSITEKCPSGTDPISKVESKDIIISPTVSARLYLPPNCPEKKSPILVYFHGGGFCVGTAYNIYFHAFVNSLVASSNLVAVSVDYRLAPEHPIPAAYDDSWEAIKWLSNSGDPWIESYGDLNRIIVAGESAGANIAHHMAMRSGENGVKIREMVLIHPYFMGSEAVESEAIDFERAKKMETMWSVVCPAAVNGVDDWRINPTVKNGGLARLGCERALVCVAEKDVLRDRGRKYCEALKESEWKGELVEYEALGMEHAGHLFEPGCEAALAQFRGIVEFLLR